MKILALLLIAAPALGAGPAPSPSPSPVSMAKDPPAERSFYDTLDDLMSDFEFDIREKQITGLKDISIRNIQLSENLPNSFRTHLEGVIAERVLRTAKTRVIQCPACKNRRTTVTGGDMTIINPEANPQELARIAKVQQIAHFMDIAFAYQPTGMVLSMNLIEPENGNVAWTKTYNSESSRAAAFRRGVDYSQVEDARKQTEYKPTLQYRAISYLLFEPNISTSGPGTPTSCLVAGFRLMERYDNRKKEVGFEADYIIDSSAVVASGQYTNNLWSGFNLTLLFVHAWNLIGNEENFNTARGSFFLAFGGTYSTGYLGALIRSGYEWRLAKHWAVSANLGYRPSGGFFSSNTRVEDVTGVEYGIGINYLF